MNRPNQTIEEINSSIGNLLPQWNVSEKTMMKYLIKSLGYKLER